MILKGQAMEPYEVTYKVGKYQNTLLVQAEDQGDAEAMVWKWNLIPRDAEITKVERRG
jgi:hypothetical protein